MPATAQAADWDHQGPDLCKASVVTVNLNFGEVPTAENDVILGTSRADIINGGGGNDIICGMGGNDIIRGGEGRDTIIGGPGDDKLYGGADNDTLFGNEGKDMINGGADHDQITGGPANDRLYGHSGNDSLFGSDGDDLLYGQSGDDDLWGGSGADELHGSTGADLAYGGDGADLILGGAGNDELRGGDGNDDIRGESGNDSLRGNAGADSLAGSTGIDWCNVGVANTGDTTSSCTLALDPTPPAPPPPLPGNPIVVPPLPDPPSDQLLVTWDRLDPGDDGWLDTGDGTRQWMDGTCRARVEATGVPLVPADWSFISALTLRPAADCDDILARLNPNGGTRPAPEPPVVAPPAAPEPVTVIGGNRTAPDPTTGWVELSNGRRLWVEGECLDILLPVHRPSDLTSDIYELVIPAITQETCDALVANAAALPDADDAAEAAVSVLPDDLAPVADGLDAPIAEAIPQLGEMNTRPYVQPFRMLSTTSSTHGWLDFGDGTKQYVNQWCRTRLETKGVPTDVVDFGTVIGTLTNVDLGTCGDLVALAQRPDPLPAGATFTTDGHRIIDPYGYDFIPFGANTSAEFFPSESWWSKTDEKVGLYVGDWQFNTLRLNAFCQRDCSISGTPLSTSQRIHDTIKAYEGWGVVLIIDLHTTNFPYTPTQDEVEASTEYFKDLAARYADNPYVWFNPLNEPINECDPNKHGDGLDDLQTGRANSAWIDVHQPIIEAIRGTGSQNMITLTASNYGQDRCFNQTGPVPVFESSIRRFGPTLSSLYDNLVYDLHFYGRWGNATRAAVETYFAETEALGLPVMVGELGGNAEGQDYQFEDLRGATVFFDFAPDHVGVLAWHSAFGYSLVTDNNGFAYVINAANGRPNNLSDLGNMVWDHAYN